MTSVIEQVQSHGVRWGVDAEDWRDLNRTVGDMLVSANLAEPRYVEGMIANIEKNGPYLVIAPGVALLHARPEEGAVANGIVMATVKQPVEFGHSANDPVWLALGLTATGDLDHLDLLRGVAGVLAQEGALDRLRDAASEDEFLTRLRSLEDTL